jgi:glycosyltransferase involved in cell wall biosynthesis
MLAESLEAEPGVSVLNFSFRAALVGKYDVYHSHWPEILVSGHGPLKKVARQLLALTFLARLAISRTPIVRTIHNVERPDGIGRRESALLDLIDRMTAVRIRLNPTTEVASGQAFETIPHGHYRSWFAPYDKREGIRGQLGYFGLIRRYKGVETLVRAFRQTEGGGGDLTLRLGGKPSTPELEAVITGLTDGDDRVSTSLHFLPDSELVDIVTSSEVIVLPYRFMHNSGGALTALSLDRPILVPDNPVNRLLADEVGDGWVYRYSGELTPDILRDTVTAVRADGRSDQPNLSAREWSDAAQRHVAAYRRAIQIRHPR